MYSLINQSTRLPSSVIYYNHNVFLPVILYINIFCLSYNNYHSFQRLCVSYLPVSVTVLGFRSNVCELFLFYKRQPRIWNIFYVEGDFKNMYEILKKKKIVFGPHKVLLRVGFEHTQSAK